ncbi:MAG: hypothetical protein C4536_04590 [Actinobacteria bacterium]|jgi:hypothetical protein|nr:MAG: hypothetical protein C4536_04590 [Actinomycetota bacterium]
MGASSLGDVVVYEVSGGIAWGIILGSILAAIVFYVLSAWLLYRIGKRFGYENSWYAWVPFLNLWMMTELAGRDTTFFVILLLGTFFCFIVALVMMIMLWMDIAERCGKESWYGILIIIPIVNWIIMYILGSGPAISPQPPAAGYPGQYGQYGQPPQGPQPPYAPPPQPPQGGQPPYTPPPPPPQQ